MPDVTADFLQVLAQLPFIVIMVYLYTRQLEENNRMVDILCKQYEEIMSILREEHNRKDSFSQGEKNTG